MGWDGGCPCFVAVLPPLLSAGVVCRIGGAYACGMVAAPQNLIIGDSASLSLCFCSEFSVSLATRICDGGVFALNQIWGHQGSNVPTRCAGPLQTDKSADTCAGRVRRGRVCTAFVRKSLLGELDALGEIFLLGLLRAQCYGPSAQAFKELTCFGIRGMMDNWVNERLKGME